MNDGSVASEPVASSQASASAGHQPAVEHKAPAGATPEVNDAAFPAISAVEAPVISPDHEAPKADAPKPENVKAENLKPEKTAAEPIKLAQIRAEPIKAEP